jgi:heterodisulfide reductase subunit B2
MSDFLYYPGCSMDTSARAYHDSIALVCATLGLELREIDDWNCCGASEYVSISLARAQALVARNLALAELETNGTDTLVAACSMCYLNLAKVDHQLAESRPMAERVNEALAAGGLRYDAGSVHVRHLLEVIVRDVGLDTVRERVARPLTGLRVAPYMGCLLTRPGYDSQWSSFEHPVEFDRLIEALGAEVVDFPCKTDCCGGHMTQISPSTGFELIRRLVATADRSGAHLMATVCPMCQMNVDAFQGEMNRYFRTSYHMPILFFTQLMGLAFGGEPHALGIGTELVDARAALGHIGIEVPPAEGAAVGAEVNAEAPPKPPRRPKGPELPMPRMSGNGRGAR